MPHSCLIESLIVVKIKNLFALFCFHFGFTISLLDVNSDCQISVAMKRLDRKIGGAVK